MVVAEHEFSRAVEVGPTEAEYGTTVGGGPIVGYSDAQCVYCRDIADQLIDVATELGLAPQPAVLGAFESDASHAKASGLSARGAAVPSDAEHTRIRGHPARCDPHDERGACGIPAPLARADASLECAHVSGATV
jgi:M42 glutamyl aminopeptidase